MSSQAAAQKNPFRESSKYILNGIIHGKYKKPGWREFVMPDRLEISGQRFLLNRAHPRLFKSNLRLALRPGMMTAEKERWFRFIRNAANEPVYANSRRVKSWSPAAKAAALMYAQGGERRYLQKVITYFSQLPEAPQIIDFEGGKADFGWGDFLQSAEPVGDLCVAYDLTCADLPIQVRENFNRKLVDVGETLIEGLRYTPRNNHVVVMSIAIATIALTVDDLQNYTQYTQPELLNLALEYLSESLGLISPDGGYAEGPYYARYILNYLSPFAIHLKNAANINLLNHPRLRRMVNWVLDNEKGSGNFTQFDDAFTTKFFFLPLLSNYAHGAVNWSDYQFLSDVFQDYRPNMVEALYEPDFKIKRKLQNYRQYPGRFYTDMGQAIFKNKSIQPDFFASLIFENSAYFSDVHEHIDPLALEISSAGEDFIVDGGYGAGTPDKERPYFLSQSANSVLLVDGQGTNPNPLSGDVPGAEAKYAFSTENFAGISVQHQVGDADLSRSIFYCGDNTMVMIDRMDAGSYHHFSSQFNYLGNLTIVGQERLLWQHNDAQLEYLLLNDPAKPLSFAKESGLITSGSGTKTAGKVILESEADHSVAQSGIWLGGKKQINRRARKIVTTKGNGEIWKINEGDLTTHEIGRNNGGELAAVDWQTDAEFIWLKRNGQNSKHLFMENGTVLETGQFRLKFDSPVTLYLERENMAWFGYVHLHEIERAVHLSISGNIKGIFKLNGIPLKAETSPENKIFKLTESGEISIGFSNKEVYQARKTASDDQFLQRISGKPEIRQRSTFWSDYERTQFKNEIVSNLLNAGDIYFQNQGRNLMNEPFLFHQALNVTQGLLQYGYRSTNDGKGFRLPHTYSGKYRLGKAGFQFEEDGNWRQNSVQVRHLSARANLDEKAEIKYQYFKNFEHHQSHRVFIKRSNFVVRWMNSKYLNQANNSISLNYKTGNFLIRPFLQYRQNKLTNYDVTISRNNYLFYLHSNEIEYFERVNGRIKNIRWMVSGLQKKDDSLQKYAQSLSGSIQRRHHYYVMNEMQKNEAWQYSRGMLQLYSPSKIGVINQTVNYFNDNWYYSGSIHNSRENSDNFFELSAKNGKIGRAGHVRGEVIHSLPKETYLSTSIDYRFSASGQRHETILRQIYSLPINKTFAVMPIYQLAIQPEQQLRALGTGIHVNWYMPIYFSFEQSREFSNYFYYLNFATIVRFGYPLEIQVRSQIDKRTVMFTEIQLMPGFDGFIRPGIYYRFVRGQEERLEGSLQWRW